MEKYDIELQAGQKTECGNASWEEPLPHGAGQNGECGPTIEEAFQQLEALVGKLEGGGSGLEESFQLYKQGMELVRYCGQKIDRVEKELIVLEGSEEAIGF